MEKDRYRNRERKRETERVKSVYRRETEIKGPCVQ